MYWWKHKNKWFQIVLLYKKSRAFWLSVHNWDTWTWILRFHTVGFSHTKFGSFWSGSGFGLLMFSGKYGFTGGGGGQFSSSSRDPIWKSRISHLNRSKWRLYIIVLENKFPIRSFCYWWNVAPDPRCRRWSWKCRNRRPRCRWMSTERRCRSTLSRRPSWFWIWWLEGSKP